MEIILSINEVLVATYIGSRRQAESQYRNRTPRFPERVNGELWGYNIEAAHAELAVAKYLGVYWGFGVNTFHTADIENTNLEIRHSQRNDLKIRPDDNNMIVVSVSGRSPKYKLNGWINSDLGKLEEFKSTTHPLCYFVPHSYLNPIETLKEIFNNNKIVL